jgi:type II secretion system protein G
MIRRCVLPLVLAAALPGLLSCGGAKKKPAKPSSKPAAEAEAEAPKGPSPAAKALQDFLALKKDDPPETRNAALSDGYLAQAQGKALKTRELLVLQGGVEDPAEALRKKFRELFGQEVKVVTGDELLKEFNKKADEQAQAEFGVDRKELEDKEPEELRDLWLKVNWEKKVRPPLKDRFLAGETDLADRVFLVYEGSGKKVEILMMRERGGFRYAGTWEERNEYWVGPDRTILFDLKTDADRIEAANNDLVELGGALLKFRQKQERYPSGMDGLDALLENPGGPEATRWEGPYAHHIYDPWGNRWRYEMPGKHQADSFDLWSAGPDGKDGTADDVKNW